MHVMSTYTSPDGRTTAVEKATYDNRGLISYTLIGKPIGAYGRAGILGGGQMTAAHPSSPL